MNCFCFLPQVALDENVCAECLNVTSSCPVSIIVPPLYLMNETTVKPSVFFCFHLMCLLEYTPHHPSLVPLQSLHVLMNTDTLSSKKEIKRYRNTFFKYVFYINVLTSGRPDNQIRLLHYNMITVILNLIENS